MNEILIQALLARIKAEQMDVEQVPIPYQPIIEMRLAESETSEQKEMGSVRGGERGD
jgi:hypothetical protein